jgi:hypothetical protein
MYENPVVRLSQFLSDMQFLFLGMFVVGKGFGQKKKK